MSEPEMVDPIYNDLNARLSKAQSDLASAEATLTTDQQTLKDAKPQTGMRGRALAEIPHDQFAVNRYRQLVQYLKIKLKERYVYCQKAYAIAYKEHKPWPDQAEWHRYLSHRELTTAPRSWDKHLRDIGVDPMPYKSGKAKK